MAVVAAYPESWDMVDKKGADRDYTLVFLIVCNDVLDSPEFVRLSGVLPRDYSEYLVVVDGVIIAYDKYARLVLDQARSSGRRATRW